MAEVVWQGRQRSVSTGRTGSAQFGQNLMRTRWRRLLDVDDAEHLCGVAELFNLDGAHINSSPSKVRPAWPSTLL
jgi:2-hydroxychromene-2-carboxylate isomerase